MRHIEWPPLCFFAALTSPLKETTWRSARTPSIKNLTVLWMRRFFWLMWSTRSTGPMARSGKSGTTTLRKSWDVSNHNMLLLKRWPARLFLCATVLDDLLGASPRHPMPYVNTYWHWFCSSWWQIWKDQRCMSSNINLNLTWIWNNIRVTASSLTCRARLEFFCWPKRASSWLTRRQARWRPAFLCQTSPVCRSAHRVMASLLSDSKR